MFLDKIKAQKKIASLCPPQCSKKIFLISVRSNNFEGPSLCKKYFCMSVPLKPFLSSAGSKWSSGDSPAAGQQQAGGTSNWSGGGVGRTPRYLY